MYSSNSVAQILDDYVKNGGERILARVRPSCPRFFVHSCQVTNIDGCETAVLRVDLTSPPEEGKANEELLRELERLSPYAWTLISGQQQRQKILQRQRKP